VSLAAQLFQAFYEGNFNNLLNPLPRQDPIRGYTGLGIIFSVFGVFRGQKTPTEYTENANSISADLKVMRE
jgi:hypothetical protein